MLLFRNSTVKGARCDNGHGMSYQTYNGIVLL